VENSVPNIGFVFNHGGGQFQYKKNVNTWIKYCLKQNKDIKREEFDVM
jgi:hypothetical protein